MICADWIFVPHAALAIVLAITMAACCIACDGRSALDVPARNSASSRATVMARPLPFQWRALSILLRTRQGHVAHWNMAALEHGRIGT
jgi:hypothetical protein